MRKLKAVFLMCVLVFASVCAGCTSNGSDVSSLTGHECWYFYNEALDENEVMSFSTDYGFSYRSESGKPINDSDLYNAFSYNPASFTISLSGDEEDSEKDINVLSHNDYHLMVKIDGKVKTFTPERISSGFSYFGGETYIGGYEGYCSIFEYDEDGSFLVGPFNYDGDVEYPEGTMEVIDAAENIEFYNLDIYTEMNGDEAEHEVSYTKLTLKEVKQMLTDSSASAFMWYNDNLEIEKMVFYGQLIVQN